MKKTAIVQSNYIPWKGYFDIIALVDEFIIFDDVQYTSRDWRNRNIIKTPQGPLWLSIPVISKNSRQKINQIKVADKSWAKNHWETIRRNYTKSTYFEKYKDCFESIYSELTEYDFLSEINLRLIKEINKILGISTIISDSKDYNLIEGKTERLLQLCIDSGAGEYVSGPAAKEYLDGNLFKDAGICLTWMDYDGYSEYTQLNPPFIHGVSVLDLIFNEGENAVKFMKFENLKKEEKLIDF